MFVKERAVLLVLLALMLAGGIIGAENPQSLNQSDASLALQLPQTSPNSTIKDPAHPPQNASTMWVPKVVIYLNIRAFLEGPYTSGGQMGTDLNAAGDIPVTSPYEDARTYSNPVSTVVDWVSVELKETASGSALYQKSYFIRNDGYVCDGDGNTDITLENVYGGYYYLRLRHRNHLSIMSASPIEISATPASYDFTTGLDKYYGNDAKEVETGVFAMYAGDASGNDQVQNDDKNDHWSIQVGQAGYLSADFNLNGQVQNDDKNDFWSNNVGKGSQVP